MPTAADNWGYTDEGLKHYTARRAAGPIVVDGHLDEPTWQHAPRSPRFEDLEEGGRPALFDTQAAIVWDDTFLYVGFWCEEPELRATYVERDSMICAENDVEVFIAGADAYFEFEHWWGFYGLYGFASYVFIVMSSKGLRRILRREEDYYEQANTDDAP